MSRYVDGFILPVPAGNLEQYRKTAAKAGEIWKEHGALAYVECIGDDLFDHPLRTFPEMIKADSTEEIIFSWIIFESKEHRDSVNAKVIADPRMKNQNEKELGFDCEKITYGGFNILISI